MSSLKENKNKTFSSDIVDLSFLNEHLSSDLDQLSQMITIFLEQNPNKIELLKESVSSNDFAAIKSHSHFLKSSFTIMGLSSVSCLSEIELLSIQSKDIEKIIALSNIVMRNFNESVIEYEKIRAEILLKKKK